MACACSPNYSGGWGMRIAFTGEAEAAMGQIHTTALQPGWHSGTLSQKKKKESGGWVFSLECSGKSTLLSIRTTCCSQMAMLLNGIIWFGWSTQVLQTWRIRIVLSVSSFLWESTCSGNVICFQGMRVCLGIIIYVKHWWAVFKELEGRPGDLRL